MTRTEFAEGIALLTATVGRQMPDEQLAAWFAMLKDLSAEQLRRGIVKTLQTHQFAGFPPIGSVLSNCNTAGTIGSLKDRSLLAWHDARKCISRVGPGDSIDFDDPLINAVIRALGGWPSFCQVETSKIQWLEKDFREMYAALACCPLREDQTRRLSGQFEINHSRDGYTAEPVRIQHVRCLTGGGDANEWISLEMGEQTRPPARIVSELARSLPLSTDSPDGRTDGGARLAEPVSTFPTEDSHDLRNHSSRCCAAS
ncbi:MAG: hypothetical protein HQ518_33175 [Rhodopirellula sp.]|nr:hypothetical protein [Rhodopirellula sp.]